MFVRKKKNVLVKLNREESRKQRELDEDRKVGKAPYEKDEDGNEINPYIPTYIAKAPWYMETGGGQPSLKHQRKEDGTSSVAKDKDNFDKWYQRGIKLPASTTYRKGACENCGAMTHKVKDCLERPRKISARLSGQNIAADDLIEDIQLGFDAKRDRWNGYDPDSFSNVLDNFEYLEEQKQKLQLEEESFQKIEESSMKKKKTEESDLANINDILFDDDLFGDIEEEKEDQKADMPGQKVDLKSRMTVRNLRLREDTAKYLNNLDCDAADYDPKSRTHRTPKDEKKDNDEVGKDFVPSTLGSSKFTEMQVFCWQAQKLGIPNVHLQANPSETERILKSMKPTDNLLKQQPSISKQNISKSLLDKYGDIQCEEPPDDLF